MVLAGLMLTLVSISAQNTLNNKKKELEHLRQSIEATQKKLDRLQRDESSASKSLSSQQKQRHRITVFIRQLQDELARLQDSANVLRGQIRQTQQALSDAEQAYNRTAVNLASYHARHQGDLGQSVSVDPVFRAMSTALASYRNSMLQLQDSLQTQQNLLQEYSTTQSTALSARAKEEKLLSASISKSSQQLNAIRADKKAVQRELKKKQQSATQLRTIINRLVLDAQRKAEAEQRKALAEKRKAQTSGKPPATPTKPAESVKGFAANSLPWPTASHKLLHGYGFYTNPQTGTTLENPGIDISAPVGTTVKCVATGEVSSVTWLPGFGSLVIVDHGNGVRTVYANLATVSVGKGAKVGAGSTLGTSGENIDGALVHFEVWNGKSRQNPASYLK
jgi:septal ring factor EnvC (AmiA/AmiB activator)